MAIKYRKMLRPRADWLSVERAGAKGLDVRSAGPWVSKRNFIKGGGLFVPTLGQMSLERKERAVQTRRVDVGELRRIEHFERVAQLESSKRAQRAERETISERAAEIRSESAARKLARER